MEGGASRQLRERRRGGAQRQRQRGKSIKQLEGKCVRKLQQDDSCGSLLLASLHTSSDHKYNVPAGVFQCWAVGFQVKQVTFFFFSKALS